MVRTRELIREKSPRVKEERAALQRAGERWTGPTAVTGRERACAGNRNGSGRGPTRPGSSSSNSARIPGQIEAIRQAYGPAVHHVHLDAEEEELRRRYAKEVTGRGSCLNTRK